MTILTALRTETSALHHAIESQYPMSVFAQSDFTTQEYACVLRCLLRWYDAVLPPSRAGLSGTPFAALLDDELSQFLVKDLQMLGQFTRLSTLQKAPLVMNTWHCIGACYVILGSSLGSAYILKRINVWNKKQPNPLPVAFYSANKQQSAQWKAYIELLDDVNDNNAHMVVQGATLIFAQLQQIMTELTICQPDLSHC
ncbi:biliverdin-producing heme oxygenase [Aestuariibacter salexigens]|uniref:biliverdin-producing heme oxygenase n=1 Tax=Aestuariibacter salexigens TaxID=226010 RepID=UPI00146FADEE|nr:biliverdin-producing heme oxygenase [Aestuariibacter salexigens]